MVDGGRTSIDPVVANVARELTIQGQPAGSIVVGRLVLSSCAEPRPVAPASSVASPVVRCRRRPCVYTAVCVGKCRGGRGGAMQVALLESREQ